VKKIKSFQQGKPKWDLKKLCSQRQEVQDTPGKNLGATECEIGNMEVQWNSIKESVLDTVSGLLVK
jgi:hypothetical protein